jgi:cardiolipin synthase
VTDEQVSDRILTIPNVISFIRLAGVGVFWWVLLGLEDFALAALLIFVIGWTDWIDGYLARRLNQVSKLGKALDPVADRVMIASAVIGGMIAGILPLWFGWLLIIREAFMGLVTLPLMSRGKGPLEVRYLGKLSTFILYGAIPAFYFAEAGILESLMRALAWTFGLIGLAMYWVVALQYLGDARKLLAGLESTHDSEES